MSAVLGGDPDEVLAAIEKHGLYPANRTAPARSWPPVRSTGSRRSRPSRRAKARVMPLQVAGAFHTPYMASAREALAAPGRRPAAGRPEPAPALQRRRPAGRPRRRGAVPAGPPGHRPVRWDLCMRTPARPRRHRGHRAAAGRHARRAGQAGAQGLGRRDRRAVNTPDDLTAPATSLAGHGVSRAPSYDWRFVVAPAPAARSARPTVDEGTRPARRQAARALITHPPRGTSRSPPHDGVLAEWLAHEEDPVDTGDPLARLYPEVSE